MGYEQGKQSKSSHENKDELWKNKEEKTSITI